MEQVVIAVEILDREAKELEQHKLRAISHIGASHPTVANIVKRLEQVKAARDFVASFSVRVAA